MKTTPKLTTGIAALATAAALGLGIAGPAAAATGDPACTGTGPGAALSAAQHVAFDKEMTALKKQRDAIMAKYGKSAPTAGRGSRPGAGQGMGPGRRGSGAALSAAKRTAMQKELAAWRVKRDALFAEYGLVARSRGRAA
ncbi:MAG: hypothetical protein MUF09_02130 [Candidatus Nanopelagicales bacterium]|jgi:hypothetical protein|nr:hypothetical protein [Candidatus Nanopelagicales bacterium]